MAELPSQLRGASVLIVDDTPANLKILRQALEPEGYDIHVASNGESALRIARDTHPDLILLDVMMPGIDGYQVCSRLKQDESTRDIPVIFVTAKTDLEGIVEGFHAGGIDYIVKPFQNEEVLARTRTHLERHLLGRALAEKNLELERKNEELLNEIDQRRRLTSERNHLVEQLSHISAREAEHWGIEGFIGRSSVLQKIVGDIARL